MNLEMNRFYGSNFMSDQQVVPPTEPASLRAEAMSYRSPDQMNSSSPTSISWDQATELNQDDQVNFIVTLVDMLSAASDTRVLETYKDVLKAFSDSEKKEFAVLLAKKVGSRMGQPLGNPLQDNEYRRGPKLIRHFHLAGPLIIAQTPGFTERHLKAEFWRIWKWCGECGDLEELDDALVPLSIYAVEFAKEGERFGKVLRATIAFLGAATLSEARTVEAIYSKLTGIRFDLDSNDYNYFTLFVEESGVKGVSDVFLTSLRLGVPLQIVIEKLNSLPTKPPCLKTLSEWIKLALNQDAIISDQVTEEMRQFLREFAVISAAFKEPFIDYLKLKRPEVIRALFGAIWESAEADFPAVRRQFIRMMETVGYTMDGNQFKDTLTVINSQLPSPILYIRLDNNPVKILLFYMMVKVLRMEVEVWPIIQAQNRILMQMSYSPMTFYGPIFDAIPEALEYFDSCHRALLQSTS